MWSPLVLFAKVWSCLVWCTLSDEHQVLGKKTNGYSNSNTHMPRWIHRDSGSKFEWPSHVKLRHDDELSNRYPLANVTVDNPPFTHEQRQKPGCKLVLLVSLKRTGSWFRFNKLVEPTVKNKSMGFCRCSDDFPLKKNIHRRFPLATVHFQKVMRQTLLKMRTSGNSKIAIKNYHLKCFYIKKMISFFYCILFYSIMFCSVLFSSVLYPISISMSTCRTHTHYLFSSIFYWTTLKGMISHHITYIYAYIVYTLFYFKWNY